MTSLNIGILEIRDPSPNAEGKEENKQLTNFERIKLSTGKPTGQRMSILEGSHTDLLVLQPPLKL